MYVIICTLSKIYDSNEQCMQKHLYERYSSAGHFGFLYHVPITFIDKTDHSDPLKMKDY